MADEMKRTEFVEYMEAFEQRLDALYEDRRTLHKRRSAVER